jgi:D-3-phosphoglycerate dehydrogenase / 2-oxoglutarate reductase
MVRSTRKIGSDFIKTLSLRTDIKIICTVSSGFDNVDIKSCKEYGITTLNVYGGNVISAAEHTFALILAASKNLIAMNSKMSKGIFDNASTINTELYGKTIGIVGVGRIGSLVAKYARSFGMKVVGNDINLKLKNKYKWIKFVSLNQLLKSSDIITIHTPLDESTYHIINRKNIILLKRDAIFINCSRGGTVDEKELIKLLQKKKLRYAGIDIFESEPAFNKQFTKLNNVILTPHAAGKTVESRKRMSILSAENIIRHYKNPKFKSLNKL